MTFALIQARQSSSRFNNKIFQDLKGNYVIDWVIDRISLSNKIKKINEIDVVKISITFSIP